jgi:DNA-binding XRE family transcriptional regulator
MVLGSRPKEADFMNGAGNKGELARKARTVLGASTAEAAQLVHVAKRTWEVWESGQREMPDAALELFIHKITHGIAPTEDRELVVVVTDNRMPHDVISSDTFLHLKDNGDGTAEISSMAVSRMTGRQYIHRTTFKIQPHNEHVLRFADKHRKWD